MTNVEKSYELGREIGKGIVDRIGMPTRSVKRSAYAKEAVELRAEALAAVYTELRVLEEDVETIAQNATETFQQQDPVRIFEAARSVVQAVTRQGGERRGHRGCGTRSTSCGKNRTPTSHTSQSGKNI